MPADIITQERIGATGYLITAATYREVQDEITRLMASVEDGTGMGSFRGPHQVRRYPPLFEATGLIMMARPTS